MLVNMGMKITASVNEPFGWWDICIIARKEPVILADLQSDLPIWPASRIQHEDSSLKSKIRRKLRLLLIGE
jgi:hypothetical protein